MVLSVLAATLCVALIGFGCWVVTEGNRLIAEKPAISSTVRTNQFFLVIGGGLIATMVFILLGLAVAPNSPMTPWAPACMFFMPFAPIVGALATLAFKKVNKFIRN